MVRVAQKIRFATGSPEVTTNGSRRAGRSHQGIALDLRAPSESMSQHNSLRASGTTGAKRNVLKRFERVAILKSRAQWKEGDRVTGLRKTRPPE